MLNQSLRIRLIVLGLLIFSVNIISAQEDDNLGTEVVNIIKPYTPTISDAFKVKENPLSWLEWVLNGADHTNFFENRVTEYEVAGLTGDWDSAYKQ